MKPELLVLIEDRPEAQRLIVTWERAWEEFRERGFSGSTIRPEFKMTDPFVEAWSSISDVDVQDIETLCPVLFVNDILGPEGAVESWVVDFVRARMTAMMRGELK